MLTPRPFPFSLNTLALTAADTALLATGYVYSVRRVEAGSEDTVTEGAFTVRQLAR